jgi:hypothetical protein
MNAKVRMTPAELVVNPRERWHPLAKLGVNYRSFGLNEGHFRRKPLFRKDLQMYGSVANSSYVLARTYGAKRRMPGKTFSVSIYQIRTCVEAQNFIRKSAVKQSITPGRAGRRSFGQAPNDRGRNGHSSPSVAPVDFPVSRQFSWFPFPRLVRSGIHPLQEFVHE